jgi:hypothetical protein
MHILVDHATLICYSYFATFATTGYIFMDGLINNSFSICRLALLHHRMDSMAQSLSAQL